eukprot:scaffold73741_cov56-Phaeocystis_antarctica.AAC.2
MMITSMYIARVLTLSLLRRGARAIARRGGAARHRRDAATTFPVADPPTALAVSAEAASCAARAVLSDSVSCMLAARRVCSGSQEICVTTNTHLGARSRLPTRMPAPARTRMPALEAPPVR